MRGIEPRMAALPGNLSYGGTGNWWREPPAGVFRQAANPGPVLGLAALELLRGGEGAGPPCSVGAEGKAGLDAGAVIRKVWLNVSDPRP